MLSLVGLEAQVSSTFFTTQCEHSMRLNGKKDLKLVNIYQSMHPSLSCLVLLTLNQGQELFESVAKFKYMHTLSKIVAKRALVRFKDMLKIVQNDLWRPDKQRLLRITLVCCILHSIVINLEHEVCARMLLDHYHDGS